MYICICKCTSTHIYIYIYIYVCICMCVYIFLSHICTNPAAQQTASVRLGPLQPSMDPEQSKDSRVAAGMARD